MLPSKNGYEASGIVEAVGEGVDGGWMGKTVSTVPAFRLNKHGVYGEVAIVPAEAIARVSGEALVRGGHEHLDAVPDGVWGAGALREDCEGRLCADYGGIELGGAGGD